MKKPYPVEEVFSNYTRTKKEVLIINLSKKLAGILACFTLLIIGSVVLLNAMSLDYHTVFAAGKYGILGAITAGVFGHLIGSVFEKSKRK